ncbi:MAG TPA: HAMP domain-containing sensor histidine kinase [Intrasporangium sp.]|nr:HAMP domain-containing sensor histidine kinase [Intrasporangium sp.]
MASSSDATQGDDTFRGRRLGTRLLLAQALVVTASIITAALVAVMVGPAIFHQHLIESGGLASNHELEHIERAFTDASALSLGIASVTALICALAVTWYVTRRIQRPLNVMTHAAREMGRGHYDVRASIPGSGPELQSLAAAFNAMAARLEASEQTRRRLLSDVAHELRTPVATIRAYLDGLDDGLATWGPEVSKVFHGQTGRLARLCDDIAEVSRAEEHRISLERDHLHVGDLLEAAVGTARPAYDAKGVDLILTRSDASRVSVDVDPERIGQVMANLLGNALRHTPPGGTVTIGADIPAATAAEGEVVVLVNDTGEGISAEQLPHVFERFYRGDTARSRDSGGSGIGLTIAKALVDAHGGSLRASSPGKGHGSTFAMTLPRADVARCHATQQAVVSGEPT